MPDIFPQKEIDTLLSAISIDQNQDGSPEICKYSYKHPLELSKEHILVLNSIFKNLGQYMSDVFSKNLKIPVCFHPVALDQISYEKFIKYIPDESVMGIIGLYPLNGKGVIEIDPRIIAAIIDHFCCWSDNSYSKQTGLGEIGKAIIEIHIKQILDCLTKSFQTIYLLDPFLEEVRCDPLNVRIASSEEAVIMVTIESKVGKIEGMINFCIPYAAMKPLLVKLDHHAFSKSHKAIDAYSRKKKNMLLKTRLKSYYFFPLTGNYDIKKNKQMEKRDLFTCRCQ